MISLDFLRKKYPFDQESQTSQCQTLLVQPDAHHPSPVWVTLGRTWYVEDTMVGRIKLYEEVKLHREFEHNFAMYKKEQLIKFEVSFSKPLVMPELPSNVLMKFFRMHESGTPLVQVREVISPRRDRVYLVSPHPNKPCFWVHGKRIEFKNI